jgi:hypothetical protein
MTTIQPSALEQPSDEEHLSFVNASKLLPGFVRLRRNAPSHQRDDGFLRSEAQQIAGNDTRHIAELHALASAADVVVNDQPRAVEMQADERLLAVENRMADK